MSVEINTIREMVRADLELAFEHLNNDLPELAEHELRNALEKVAQIKEIQRADAVSHGLCGAHTQQPLLTLPTTDEQQTHGS